MTRRNQAWTSDEIDELFCMVVNKESINSIAKLLQRSREAVLTAHQKIVAQQLIFHTAEEVASIYGMTIDELHNYIGDPKYYVPLDFENEEDEEDEDSEGEDSSEEEDSEGEESQEGDEDEVLVRADDNVPSNSSIFFASFGIAIVFTGFVRFISLVSHGITELDPATSHVCRICP